jgi:hypothetical protein
MQIKVAKFMLNMSDGSNWAKNIKINIVMLFCISQKMACM